MTVLCCGLIDHTPHNPLLAVAFGLLRFPGTLHLLHHSASRRNIERLEAFLATGRWRRTPAAETK